MANVNNIGTGKNVDILCKIEHDIPIIIIIIDASLFLKKKNDGTSRIVIMFTIYSSIIV